MLCSFSTAAQLRGQRGEVHCEAPAAFSFVTLSFHMSDNRGFAGAPRPRVSDSTRRFMLLNSFLETQRTSRSALATIQHFSSLTHPLPVADAAPTANDDGDPGRGVALVGMRRPQTRVGGRQQYAAVRGHHDPTLFKTLCSFTREEFDAIVELARQRVEMPMDPRLCYLEENNQARRPRRRVCSTVEIILLTLVLLRGGD